MEQDTNQFNGPLVLFAILLAVMAGVGLVALRGDVSKLANNSLSDTQQASVIHALPTESGRTANQTNVASW